MTLANTSFPGGGNYAVEIMLVTMAQANATSPTPSGSTAFATRGPARCTNLVFVRSTGTVTDSPQGAPLLRLPPATPRGRRCRCWPGRTRPRCSANGLVGGTPARSGRSTAMSSFRLGPSPRDSRGRHLGHRLERGGGGSQQPERGIHRPRHLRRVPAQQAVCAPTGDACATPNLYSLGRSPRWRDRRGPAVVLAGYASVGTAISERRLRHVRKPARSRSPARARSTRSSWPTAARTARARQLTATSPSQTPFVDMGAIGRAYPENPVSPFPLLTGANPVAIGAATYAAAPELFLHSGLEPPAELSAAGRRGTRRTGSLPIQRAGTCRRRILRPAGISATRTAWRPAEAVSAGMRRPEC